MECSLALGNGWLPVPVTNTGISIPSPPGFEGTQAQTQRQTTSHHIQRMSQVYKAHHYVHHCAMRATTFNSVLSSAVTQLKCSKQANHNAASTLEQLTFQTHIEPHTNPSYTETSLVVVCILQRAKEAIHQGSVLSGEMILCSMSKPLSL